MFCFKQYLKTKIKSTPFNKKQTDKGYYLIIACDIGLKRIGLACCIDGIVLPIEPIMRINRHQAASDFSKMLALKNAELLIVGLPDIKESKETHMRILHFIKLIDFQGKIIYVNEDYSSTEALQHTFHMKKGSRKQAKKNGIIDSLAACVIMQKYLDSNKLS